ncbi:MAG: tetratricopeptide repeat protein [Bryobacteraceae bacterium]
MVWLYAALLLFEDSYRQGIELLSKAKYAEAEVALKAALQKDSKNAEAWKALGVVYAKQEQHGMAEEPFANACRIAPKLEDACYFHARNQYALNKFDASLDALKLDSQQDRVQLGMAQALEALGRTTEAEAAFQAAIRLNPKARIEYAVFLYRQGRTQDAVAPLQAAIAREAGAARPRFELGRVFLQLGRYSEAASQFDEAIKLGYGQAASTAG